MVHDVPWQDGESLEEWTRVAAYVVCLDAGRVLLAHWQGVRRSGWTLPGGGIDFGEDPADAARREVLEETGLVVELGPVLGVDPIRVRTTETEVPLDMHGLRIVHAGYAIGGRLRDEVGGSTDRAAWIDPQAVPTIERVELVDTALRWFADGRGA